MKAQGTILRSRFLPFAAPLALLAGPALATPIQVNFTGTVSVAALGTTANSGYTEGQSISGQFFIDSVSGVVSGATLGSYSAATDNGDAQISAFSSTNDAIFSQGAFDSGGASSNDSIIVDLSAASSFSATSPVSLLLQNASALQQQINFSGAGTSFPSTVAFYSGAGNGTGITAVYAYLTSLTVLAASVTESATTVNAGQTSTLTVTPAGSGPFTYQWYEGTSGNASNPIAGATGGSFTTPPLGSTTTYWVQVTNTSTGLIEDSATITVTVTQVAPPTDGPLPLWALIAAAASLMGIGSRRLKKKEA